jgi:hypothetical protein
LDGIDVGLPALREKAAENEALSWRVLRQVWLGKIYEAIIEQLRVLSPHGVPLGLIQGAFLLAGR